MSKPLGANHLLRWSSLVQVSNTSSRGASKTRVVTNSSWDAAFMGMLLGSVGLGMGREGVARGTGDGCLAQQESAGEGGQEREAGATEEGRLVAAGQGREMVEVDRHESGSTARCDTRQHREAEGAAQHE